MFNYNLSRKKCPWHQCLCGYKEKKLVHRLIKLLVLLYMIKSTRKGTVWLAAQHTVSAILMSLLLLVEETQQKRSDRCFMARGFTKAEMLQIGKSIAIQAMTMSDALGFAHQQGIELLFPKMKLQSLRRLMWLFNQAWAKATLPMRWCHLQPRCFAWRSSQGLQQDLNRASEC